MDDAIQNAEMQELFQKNLQQEIGSLHLEIIKLKAIYTVQVDQLTQQNKQLNAELSAMKAPQ